MLDLSCEFKSKKIHVTIDKKLNVLINGKEQTFYRESKQDCIGVVEVLKAACLKYKTQNIFKQDFKLVVESIKMVEEVRKLLKDIRGTHLNNDGREKIRDELNSFVNDIFYTDKYRKIKFSKSQELAIHDLTDEKLYYGISCSDFDDLYLPVSRNSDKINKFYEELIAFPFGLMDCNYESIVKDIDDKKEISLLKIKAFESLMDQAGDDIVNWSQHKISRRLGEMDIKIKNEYRRGYDDTVSYYQIREYVETVIKNLNSKGIVAAPVEIKEKKPGTKDKIIEKKNNGGELTQSEILTLFKQSDRTIEMLNLMTYPTICEVMASPLKVVKEKLLSRYSQVEQGARHLITRAMELAPHNKQEFDRIFSYATSIKHDLPWEYIYLNIDHISTETVLDLASSYRDMGEIPSEFYDKHFKHLNNVKLLNINCTVTREFVSRLSEEDKIGVLPCLGDKFFKKSDKNSINFILEDAWWDSVPSVSFRSSELFDLYKDVPWEKIKKTVLGLHSLRKNSSEFAILHNDKESAAIIIKESVGSIKQEERVSLLKMFKRAAKIKMVVAHSSEFLRCYNELFTTQEDLLILFEQFISANNTDYVKDILTKARQSKMDMSLFRDVILHKKEIYSLTLTSEVLKLLDRSTKDHLLRIGTAIDAPAETSYYGQRTTGLSQFMIEFFKGYKREELVSFLGENLADTRYYLHLCHVMTLEERAKSCDKDSKFLRAHIESMHYDYLKKYQDKTAFKAIIGNRREKVNQRFANALETKINPANSIKFVS